MGADAGASRTGSGKSERQASVEFFFGFLEFEREASGGCEAKSGTPPGLFGSQSISSRPESDIRGRNQGPLIANDNQEVPRKGDAVPPARPHLWRPAWVTRPSMTNEPVWITRLRGNRDANLIGTNRDDTLYGTNENRTIVGLHGNDALTGFGGADLHNLDFAQ
jgi:Ca2+-binding RTX toxin-like protein